MEELNLLEGVKSSFTPEMVQRIGSFAHESPEKTGRVINEAVPAVVAQMADRASSAEGAANLYEMAKDAPMMGSLLGESSEGVAEKGQGLLARLFGDRREAASAELVMKGSSKTSMTGKRPAV